MILVLCYSLLAIVLSAVLFPFIFAKIVLNSMYTEYFSKKKGKEQEILRVTLLGIPIILASLLVDFFSLNIALLQDESELEYKY